MPNNKKPTIIAFSGKRGCGKSEAAAVLVRAGYVDLKFADPLKNMLRAMYATYGVSASDIERRLEGDLKEQPDEWLAGRTPRHAMQTLGTEWREMIATSLWSDMMRKRVGLRTDKIVISDLRFPHEVETLRALGATIVRIKRSVSDTVADEASRHASESLTDDLDHDTVLYNNSTLDHFIQDIEKAFT